MKLSEAIRLGALLHPQCFGSNYQYDPHDGHAVATCAIGAAHAAGFDIFGSTLSALARSPIFPCRKMMLLDVITDLNDMHKWTREQIADWVASVEPDETTDAQSISDDVRVGQPREMPDLALRVCI